MTINVLNRHLMVRYSLLFSIVMIAFFSLFFTLGIADEISRRVSGDYTIPEAVWFKLTSLPAEMYQYVPPIFAVVVAMAIGNLGKTSELTIIKLTARGTYGLIFRLLLPFLLFIPIMFSIGEYFAPNWATQAEIRKASLRGQTPVAESTWFSAGNLMVNAGYIDRHGNLFNVRTFEIVSNELIAWSSFEQAIAQDQHWLIEESKKSSQYVNGQQSFEIEERPVLLLEGLTPKLVAKLNNKIDQLTLRNLMSLYRYNKSQNIDDPSTAVAFWSRVFMPLEVVAMLFAAMAISMVSYRQTTVGEVVFRALVVALALNFFFDLTSSLLAIIGLTDWLAVLAPLFFIVLLFLKITVQRI